MSSPTHPIQSEPRKPRVLLIEDEPTLADTVAYALRMEGMDVVLARDGEGAIQRFRSDGPSIVLLDVMLPGLSGLDVCRLIRAESTVPIVILTAKDSESDKVAGLELGADDYVTKPFSMRELVSRLRAHLRRAGMLDATTPASVRLAGGPVELDPERHEAMVRGAFVAFTPKEFELLETFLGAKGRLLTREYLIREV